MATVIRVDVVVEGQVVLHVDLDLSDIHALDNAAVYHQQQITGG